LIPICHFQGKKQVKDAKKMKIPELKSLLTEQGLSTVGKKEELVAHLQEGTNYLYRCSPIWGHSEI
jgi:hypothetical protein